MKVKHHFIPRFYLNNFTSIDNPGEIWTYDMEALDTRLRSVESTAFEKYLYAFIQKDGSYNVELEDWIADVEKKAAPIIKKFLNDSEIQDQERADFAAFLSLMVVRTSSHRQMYAETFMAVGQSSMYAIASNEKTFELHIKKYRSIKPGIEISGFGPEKYSPVKLRRKN
jgi:hypothetical protein